MKRGVCCNPHSLLLLCFFFSGFFTKLWGTDYFFTQSSHFKEPGRFSFFIDYYQYLKQNKFGVNQYLLQEVPLKIKATLVKNVEVGVSIPVVFGQNYLTSETLSPVIGNIELELRFANHDEEYDYQYSYYFNYRISTGVVAQKLSPSELDGDVIRASYYPVASSLDEMQIGWHMTKKITPKTEFHFNFNYTYQFTNNENITNLIGLEGFESEIETNARGGKLSQANFTFLGLDKTFRRLFWTTSLNDPWEDKKNDHFVVSMVLDTYLGMDYYFDKRKLLIGLKPFIEFTWLFPFSNESFYNPKLLIVPGVYLKFTRYFGYLFGLGLVFDNWQYFDFEQVVFMSLRVYL